MLVLYVESIDIPKHMMLKHGMCSRKCRVLYAQTSSIPRKREQILYTSYHGAVALLVCVMRPNWKRSFNNRFMPKPIEKFFVHILNNQTELKNSFFFSMNEYSKTNLE